MRGMQSPSSRLAAGLAGLAVSGGRSEFPVVPVEATLVKAILVRAAAPPPPPLSSPSTPPGMWQTRALTNRRFCNGSLGPDRSCTTLVWSVCMFGGGGGKWLFGCARLCVWLCIATGSAAADHGWLAYRSVHLVVCLIIAEVHVGGVHRCGVAAGRAVWRSRAASTGGRPAGACSNSLTAHGPLLPTWAPACIRWGMLS